MRFYLDWHGPAWHEEDYDPSAKLWKCTCGECQRRAMQARILLMLLFWDLDRLFRLG